MNLGRYKCLIDRGDWGLAWTGEWDWLPVHCGQSMGATLVYRRMYGTRWSRIWSGLRWGPFDVYHRLPQNFETHQRAMADAAANRRRNPFERKCYGVRFGSVGVLGDVDCLVSGRVADCAAVELEAGRR